MNVPEKLINFRVYQDSNDLIGVADVELPSLENMTETIKGAGIAGEIDSPVLGHFSSMETVLNWRTILKNNITLLAQTGVTLDLRGAQQIWDSSAGSYTVMPVKCVIQGTPKSTELGKFDVGAATDTSNTIETTYIKLTIDGTDVLEIDKYNFIATINGTDYLSDVRTSLGLS